MIKMIECPRDAMQGIQQFIPTSLKADYLNLLLSAGFDTIDFGSFVSEKAIPQLRDTAEVLSLLDMSETSSKLLAITANLRGVQTACEFPQISYIGFPFSISETFQQRNTNSSIQQSIDTVKGMLELCEKHNKTPVIYLSMGFGNPYGDEWSTIIVEHWSAALADMGVRILSLADTTGESNPEQIQELFPQLKSRFPHLEWGLHLHSNPMDAVDKLKAALTSGCTRIDSAIKGYGGCPMASDQLTGNIPTETLIGVLKQKGVDPGIQMNALEKAMDFSDKIFLNYH